MQWLNKLDGVLDSVLLASRNNNNDNDNDNNENSEDFDDLDDLDDLDAANQDPFDEYELNGGLDGDLIHINMNLQQIQQHQQLNQNNNHNHSNTNEDVYSSLAHGVEEQLLIRRQKNAVGGLPRPGVIRPVLREHSEDGDSSFMDTDDEHEHDTQDNDHDNTNSKDPNYLKEHYTYPNTNTNTNTSNINTNTNTSNTNTKLQLTSTSISTPREIQTVAQSLVKLSPLYIPKLKYKMPLNAKPKPPPPLHAFPEPILSSPEVSPLKGENNYEKDNDLDMNVNMKIQVNAQNLSLLSRPGPVPPPPPPPPVPPPVPSVASVPPPPPLLPLTNDANASNNIRKHDAGICHESLIVSDKDSDIEIRQAEVLMRVGEEREEDTAPSEIAILDLDMDMGLENGIAMNYENDDESSNAANVATTIAEENDNVSTNMPISMNDLVLFDDQYDNDADDIMPIKSIDMSRDSNDTCTDPNDDESLEDKLDDDDDGGGIGARGAVLHGNHDGDGDGGGDGPISTTLDQQEDKPTLVEASAIVVEASASSVASFIPTNMFSGLMTLSQSAAMSAPAPAPAPTPAPPLEGGESQVAEGLDETTNVGNNTTTGTNDVDTDSIDPSYHNAIEGMQATFGDFLPAVTFQEDSFEDDESVMTSMTELEGSDYIVDGPISWDAPFDGDAETVPKFKPSMNCHGVVHVKLLRVQHLPCSEDSSLQATFSLPPWKGRIRSEKVVTYLGPSSAGVCARWDKSSKEKKDHGAEKGEEAEPWMDNDQRGEEDKIACISMVHTYNSEDTPVPNILIELKDLALMFELDVCSLTLSCEQLMSQPGEFLRRWCSVKEASNATTAELKKKKEKDKKNPPVFLIEACFEPTDFGDMHDDGRAGNDLEIEIFDQAIEERPEERDRCDTQDSPDCNASQAQNSVKTKMTLRQMSTKRLTSRPHMFIIYSSLRPTYCVLCNTMIVWKLKGYQCEVCRIDCCADCQLRIDVEMPCGSEKAKESVKKLSESKFTLSKIYEAVAPKKEVEGDRNSEQISVDQKTATPGERRDWRDGVGTFTIRINKSCLFRNCFPPETDLNHILEANDRWLRSGDYYARVSWTDSTKTRRTKTVFQSAKPRFDSDDIVITALHYGTEFKIDVVDASTDQAIGSKLLTTQGLLQWQRDNIGWGLSLSSVMNEEPVRLERRTICLELRTNVKTGFGLDFYNTDKISETSRTGEISGWIEVDLSFEENPDLYSMKLPRPCPPRPSDDFNMEIIQLHIARITAIVQDFQRLLGSYTYIVSWKNPALTSLSLLMFVATCLRYNAEYTGCLPFALLIIFMLHSGQKRKRGGGFKVRLLEKETEAKVKEMRGATIKYRKHRPLGDLEISVLQGRNLVPQLGIRGSLVSSIMWDPLKFADESSKGSIMESDPASSAVYQIGETEGSGVTSAPEWKVAHASNELERMRQLLPSKNFLSRTNSSADLRKEVMDELTESSRNVLNFPILQPILFDGKNDEDVSEDDSEVNENTSHMKNIQLLPWESSQGALVVRIRFADVLNKLPIFDQILGDVVIPFSRIATAGSVEGWFQVLEKGSLRTVEEPSDDDSKKKSNKNDASKVLNSHTGKEVESPDTFSKIIEGKPFIYLKTTLKLPNTRMVTDIDKETSVVVAEHLIRSANAKEDSLLGFLGTSINTFNTVTGVRGNIQYLQNQLGNLLDMFEIVKNLFNFTCPEKSGMILIALSILWLVFSLIPTRFVILLGGLGQYAATFMSALKPIDKIQTDARKLETKDDYDPVSTRFMNFFSGVPTNEDLRRFYFWEAIKVGERERAVLANKKRAARLTKLWKAQWFGKLELKVKNHVATAVNERSWDWKKIFGIIQGHRFIWWGSEKDFDEGENPSGQIYFAGHSGLAGLSPLEMRELKPVEAPLVVSIFGRGAADGGQQTKISLLAADFGIKESFEGAVLNATMDKHD